VSSHTSSRFINQRFPGQGVFLTGTCANMADVEGRTIRLVRDAFPEPPTLDTAVSRAILSRVAAGEEPETLRLHRPSRVVAFGPKDRLAHGYHQAIEAAAAMGFGAVQRLAGGRAALFHEGTIAFSWATPNPLPREGIRPRFEELASIMVAAFGSLGIDARVGEVPGEYCPGEFSVNARGRTKLMGVGQRVVAGAAHVGGVVVVTGSALVRDVLIPVYRALELGWDPGTAGSLEDEVPGLLWDQAVEALTAAFVVRHDLVPGEVSPAVLALAEQLAPNHTAA
jgi:octanoyl-[GcvH]:protein N-octanoyltransferase